ncbi:MAG: IMPACT family protein [Flavobacterium sp.]
MNHFYLTIEKEIENFLFKDKNSKFFGFCFPINNELDIKKILENLKKKHYQANHFCYAYNIGYDKNLIWRANDDGEPNHSAGTPILGQINSKNLTNVLVVVIRYFGGTKLGVSGLINAYKTTAFLTLEEANIISKSINVILEIFCDYQNLNKVMKLIKENQLTITNQLLSENCKITIEVNLSKAKYIENILQNELRLEFLKK